MICLLSNSEQPQNPWTLKKWISTSSIYPLQGFRGTWVPQFLITVPSLFFSGGAATTGFSLSLLRYKAALPEKVRHLGWVSSEEASWRDHSRRKQDLLSTIQKLLRNIFKLGGTLMPQNERLHHTPGSKKIPRLESNREQDFCLMVLSSLDFSANFCQAWKFRFMN